MDEVYKNLSTQVKAIMEKNKPKSVLLQLPAGLRKYALDLANEIDAEVFIWGGSNYGACDIPNVDVDLIIHIGHNELKRIPPL